MSSYTRKQRRREDKHVYFGSFRSRADVANQFNQALPSSINILHASYDIDGYEGQALVLFEENGQLYEVNASHCSCYGLTDLWKAEETSWEAHRWIAERGEKYSDHPQELIDLIREHLDAPTH